LGAAKPQSNKKEILHQESHGVATPQPKRRGNLTTKGT
jgi:hypothetical protein